MWARFFSLDEWRDYIDVVDQLVAHGIPFRLVQLCMGVEESTDYYRLGSFRAVYAILVKEALSREQARVLKRYFTYLGYDPAPYVVVLEYRPRVALHQSAAQNLLGARVVG